MNKNKRKQLLKNMALSVKAWHDPTIEPTNLTKTPKANVSDIVDDIIDNICDEILDSIEKVS